jgi:hypothetical protein
MDLKVYYQKIRSTEASIQDVYPVVVSMESSDGGKAGRYCEVTRPIAAKMITEGTARLATAEEAKSYRDAQAAAKKSADEAADASKVQLTVVSTSDLAKLSAAKKEKS